MPIRDDGLEGDKRPAGIRGLNGKGAKDGLSRNAHMLVARQQNIKIQLLAQPVGDVFTACGKHPAGVEVPLKAAVVDADGDVRPALQRLQRLPRRRDGIGNRQSGQMLRPLPDVHMIGYDTDNAFSSSWTRLGKRTVPSLRRAFWHTQRARRAFR